MSDDKKTAFYEPCANTSNGINILRNGEPIWSSCDEDPADVTNGVYTNTEKWNDALLLCKAMAILDEAERIGWNRGWMEGRS
jgi:hypothetical protein